MSEAEGQWPYPSDLGLSGANPLFELAGRRRPIQDAWGYTLRQLATLHVGAHEGEWLLARPERSLLVLGPPRDTGKTTGLCQGSWTGPRVDHAAAVAVVW